MSPQGRTRSSLAVASVLERSWELTRRSAIAHDAGDGRHGYPYGYPHSQLSGQPPGSAAPLQAGRDIDAVAKQIRALHHDIAEIYVDAEVHLALARELIVARAKRGLDLGVLQRSPPRPPGSLHRMVRTRTRHGQSAIVQRIGRPA
jgi:hypothetical protein